LPKIILHLSIALLASLAGLLPVLAQTTSPAPAAAASRDEPRFDILEFAVEGDTLLGAAAIERAIAPFLGLQRSAADAEAARRALEKAYHDAGFLSVNVVLPPQRVDAAGGVVRLVVSAAAVSRLRITGARYFLPSRLREALPSLQTGRVPNFPEMQQELGDALRASADRDVTPLISAGDQPGTMAVELKVQDRLPLNGSIELNNKQSPGTQAGRLEAVLSYDNLFQRGHSLGWSWFYSPRRADEANIHTFTYHLPLGGAGDRLFVSLQSSDSDTPTPLGGATVSRGETWRLRWRDQLLGRPGVDHAFSLGAALRDLSDTNRNVAGFDTPTPGLRYPTFQLGYELDLSGPALGDRAGRRTRLQAEVSVSLPGLSRRDVECFGSVRDQFACKRADASAAFLVLTASASHNEPVGGWLVTTRLQGQLTDAPLVPSEQVSYGGSDSVRGFEDGAVSADVGVALRIELQPPAWRPLSWANLQPAIFWDQARTRRLRALPGEVYESTLASVGVALRLDARPGLQGQLSWAEVLQGRGRSQRVDLSLRHSF